MGYQAPRAEQDRCLLDDAQHTRGIGASVHIDQIHMQALRNRLTCTRALRLRRMDPLGIRHVRIQMQIG